MSDNNTSVIARSNTPLAVGGVYNSDPFAAAPMVVFQPFPGYSVIKGFVQADQPGVLEIYQGYVRADIAPLAPLVPPCLLVQLPFVVGNGMEVAEQIVAPYIRVRFLNSAGVPQTVFSLHIEAQV